MGSSAVETVATAHQIIQMDIRLGIQSTPLLFAETRKMGV